MSWSVLKVSDYEKKFINKLLSLDSFSSIMRLWFSEKFLKRPTTKYAYAIIYDYYKNLSKWDIPTPEYVIEKLEQKSQIDKEIIPWAIENEWLSIESIIKELHNQHLLSQIIDLSNDIVDSVKEQKDSPDILSLIKNSISRIESSTISEMSVKKYTDVKERIQNYQDKLENNEFDKGLIKFPFEKLNQYYNWIRESNLIYLMAPQKTGKTFILNEFAISAFEQRKRVLYISPEMSSDEILLRLDWFLINDNYKKIENWNLSEADFEKWTKKNEELIKIREEGWEIIIIDSKWSWFTVDKIIWYVEHYQPDLIIIDGLTLIIENISWEQDWKVIKQTSENIKKYICNWLWIPTIVAIQASAEWNNESILTSTSVWRSKAILQDVDICFAISKTTEYWITKRLFNTVDVRSWKKIILWLDFDIESWKIVQDEKLTEKLKKEYKDDYE